MSKVKIDNSYLREKILFREIFIEKLKEKNVLDVFCGKFKIWDKIKKDNYLGIDQIKTDKIKLNGDNKKYLAILDLSKFNIIDMDAYGIPYQQLDILFKNNTLQKNTIIFFTFIQVFLGIIPEKLLNLYGYPNKMIKKIPTLFSKNGFEIFKWWLSTKKIKKIKYIKYDKGYKKIYGMFIR